MDDLPFARIIPLELVESFIERKHILARRFDHRRMVFEVDPVTITSSLVGALAARVVDEDLAHGSRRGGEEMTAPLPAGIRLADQAQIGLVDERRRLKGLTRLPPGHQRSGKLAQLPVEER